MTLTSTETTYRISRADKRFIGWHLIIAVAAVTVGGLLGPLQAFEQAGWNLYPYLQPLLQSYYQGLTLHGVLNALVWTTFFITGFFTLTMIYGLKRPLSHPRLNRVGFGIMVVGLVSTAVPILLNQATVLYTFYPPLQASWAFYVGLTLVVVGSWVEGWGFFLTLRAWRRDNPGVRTPLIAMGSAITMAMWQIATIGVAVEILTMLLPAALGWTAGTDPELARTYFWFTGHPLVYFWLLPAYVSWYGMLPKQAGGKLFSDSLARLTFWLFLMTSIPVGFHHQFTDPGVPQGWKLVHTAITYAVFFPSMLTAFTVIASLEHAGRRRGGTGLVGWIRALPWSDPSVSAQLLAGILFMFGGIGGLINASYEVNLVIHNTMWVPGHFHLTVATAVTLSFMGILYWLVPHLSGKKLWGRRVAVFQTWAWFVGMAVFANAMHYLGLLGAPRRTPLGEAPYVPAAWLPRLSQVAVGGAILLVSLVLFLVVMVRTLAGPKVAAEEVPEIPVAESLRSPQLTPAWLDRWRPWLIGAFALVLVAYGPQLVQQISHMSLNTPGLKPW